MNPDFRPNARTFVTMFTVLAAMLFAAVAFGMYAVPLLTG